MQHLLGIQVLHQNLPGFCVVDVLFEAWFPRKAQSGPPPPQKQKKQVLNSHALILPNFSLFKAEERFNNRQNYCVVDPCGCVGLCESLLLGLTAAQHTCEADRWGPKVTATTFRWKIGLACPEGLRGLGVGF